MRLSPEVEMLERAAIALGPLKDEVVFVGGAVVELLLTDPAAGPSRATKDVDVLVEAGTRIEYYAIESRMREQGFRQDPAEPVICRWFGHGLIVDVMPDNPAILGFSNRWYPSALATAQTITMPSAIRIAVIDAPHLIATKLSAYLDRGNQDFYASHDLEDVVALVNGREELLAEMARAPVELRDSVAAVVRGFLGLNGFTEAVEGHLGAPGDGRSRLERVIERFALLSKYEGS